MTKALFASLALPACLAILLPACAHATDGQPSTPTAFPTPAVSDTATSSDPGSGRASAANTPSDGASASASCDALAQKWRATFEAGGTCDRADECANDANRFVAPYVCHAVTDKKSVATLDAIRQQMADAKCSPSTAMCPMIAFVLKCTNHKCGT